MIKGFEGFRAYPYTCPGGSLTIGYGTTIKPGEYTSITKEQGEALLRKSISGFERSVKNLVKVPLNQNQYDALVSFTYNVGAGALKRSTLLKKLNSGDYSGAADELLKFTKANGKVLEGLVRRREKERNLFLA
jgi:lysozyme